ncbi:MAG TPA: hypothetical protein VJ916_09295 [Anaerovoracaceae bacterium]|nr:hypothetical protein [Anaerovoracaceae bacterium]
MIGVKFCGGCNSRYDRGNALKKYSKEFNICYEYADENTFYNTLVVICGCSSICANTEGYMYNKVIIVDSEEQLYVEFEKIK